MNHNNGSDRLAVKLKSRSWRLWSVSPRWACGSRRPEQCGGRRFPCPYLNPLKVNKISPAWFLRPLIEWRKWHGEWFLWLDTKGGPPTVVSNTSRALLWAPSRRIDTTMRSSVYNYQLCWKVVTSAPNWKTVKQWHPHSVPLKRTAPLLIIAIPSDGTLCLPNGIWRYCSLKNKKGNILIVLLQRECCSEITYSPPIPRP